MAEQKGIMPLKGTIGNLTFFQQRGKFVVRSKTTLDGTRIANDPAFQRTRENNAEFKTAASAAKLLRNAVRYLAQNTADDRLYSRMVGALLKVLKSDTVNTRGNRKVTAGNMSTLVNFEFNSRSELNTTLSAPFTTSIDRVTGVVSADIPVFVPVNMVVAPNGATHFRINLGGVEANFESAAYVADLQNSAELPWDNAPTAIIHLESQLPANSTMPLFALVGIEFFQEVNGTLYPLKNGAFNALSVVNVSAV